MTYFADDAMRPLPPGGVSGPAAVAAWLAGEELPTAGIRVLRAQERHGWVRLRAMPRWAEAGEPGTLAASADLVAGLGRLGQPIVTVVRSGTGGILHACSVQPANAPLPAEVVAGLVRGSFDGAVIEALDREQAALLLAVDGWPAVALAGSPAPAEGSGIRLPSLIERLDAAAPGQDWLLRVCACPISPSAVAGWAAASHRLAAELEGLARSNEQVTYAATRDVVDADARRAFELASDERERAEAAMQRGGFLTEVLLVAPDPATVVTLAATAAGLLAPRRSQARPLRILPCAPGMVAAASGTALTDVEVARFIQPAEVELPGYGSAEPVRYQRDVPQQSPDGSSVDLGFVLDGGRRSSRSWRVPTEQFTSHVLVAGTTGSGKTSAVRSAVRQFEAAGVPVLVLSPTKGGEYVDLAHLIWSIGEPVAPGTVVAHRHLNPLEAPPGVAVMSHLDYVTALVEDSLDLPDPIPHLVRQELGRLYEDRGWDLASDTNSFLADTADYPVWPTLSELRRAVMRRARTDYAGDVASNVRGAASVRLRSLTLGAKGLVLDSDRPSRFTDLLDRTAVVSLDAVADDREKRFLMGVVFPWIIGAGRLAGPTAGRLRHVLVVEEAHRVFDDAQRASNSPAGGAPRGRFAAELAANLLSESRSSGQCVVVVDQSPRKLIDDVIANTGTKVVFAVPHEADQRAVGAAMNLTDQQRRSLVSLAPDEPLGFGIGMDGPVHLAAVPDRPPISPPTRPPGSAAASSASRRPAAGPPSAALGTLVALSDGEVRRRALDRLNELLEPAWASVTVGAAVERVGRELRWTADERDRLVGDLLDGADPAVPPDRRPFPRCRCDSAPTETARLAGQLVAMARITRDDGVEPDCRLTVDHLVPLPAGVDRLRSEVERCLTATEGAPR